MNLNKPTWISLALGIGLTFTAYAAAPTADAPTLAMQNAILAELAIDQSQLDNGYEYYMNAARLGRDAGAAKQALSLALMLNNQTLALEAAELWVNLAPKEDEANIITVDLLLKKQQISASLPYILHLTNSNNKENLNFLIRRLQGESTTVQNQLLQQLTALPNDQQANPNTQLIISLLQASGKNYAAAISTINNVLAKQPDSAQAIALKTDYLLNTQQEKAALAFVDAKAAAYPHIALIQLVCAGAYLKTQQTAVAIEKLKALAKLPGNQGIAYIMLAQIAMEEKNTTQAAKYLHEATLDPAQANMAYYLLGEIYEFENKPEQALQAYQEVKSGPQYVNSHLKAALLLSALNKDEEAINLLSDIKTQHMEEAKDIVLMQVALLVKIEKYTLALEILNRANQMIPNDIKLLFARSMVASKIQNYTQTENDLKQILQLDPNQTNALNALGYLLATNPARRQEAFSYVERALKLAPNNPAVLDTMGWLQYQNGDFQSAYEYLNKAYQLNADPIIAAHYGAVLWQINQKSQAHQVWQTALKKFPDDPNLLTMMKYFELNN